MEHSSTLRKNPSRETCEGIIKRILMTEVLENGCNKHFRFASDFMNYFESLYPASDALTKQVQRAIKALDMPKDENGYYIVNKTSAQLENEKQNLISYYKALYMEQQGLDEKTALSTAEQFVANLGSIYIYENVMYNLVEIELYDKAKSNELPRTYESISEVIARESAGKTE